MVTTPYNTGSNSNPRRFIRTGIYGYIPADIVSGTSVVDRYPIPIPPSFCICNVSIGNIGQTTNPNFRETSELHVSIDIIFSNDSNVLSVGSQILHDELSVSSRRNLYSHCRMDVTAETVQPMVPQLVSHGIPIIDTLNENSGIWSPDTSAIIRTPNTTHGSTSENVAGQGTAAVAAVGYYGEENNKTYF